MKKKGYPKSFNDIDLLAVSIDISSEVYGSIIWRRGRSFAASVPSDSSKPKKASRKVPIRERRAMVESFVQKYTSLRAS